MKSVRVILLLMFCLPLFSARGETRRLDIVAQDIVYDSLRRVIYASLSRDDARFPDKVIQINPETGEIERSIGAGQIRLENYSASPWEGRLALSEDGEFLYVALESASKIQQIKLNTWELGFQFAIGDNWHGMMFAGAFSVLPGQPETLAVARTQSNPRGVAIYDSGIPRPETTQEPIDGITYMEAGDGGAILYGYRGGTTPSGFYRIAVTESGARIETSKFESVYALRQDFAHDGGFLFTSDGHVVDAADLTWRGRFPPGPAWARIVRPDVTRGRVFFHNQESATAFSLQAFDLETFTPLKSIPVPGPAERLIRWGSDGLAFTSRSLGAIFIVRSPLLFGEGLSADLEVAQSHSPEAAVIGVPVVFTATVTNHGPAKATDVVVVNTLPGGMRFLAADSAAGGFEQTTEGVRFQFAEIESGGAVRMEIAAEPNFGGWMTNHVVAVANEADANMANNNSHASLFVQIDSTPDSINEIKHSFHDLVYHAVSGRFYASMGTGSHSGIARIDPATGVFESILLPGEEPRLLAISTDGRFLYAAINDDQSVQRIDLESGVSDLEFSLGEDSWGRTYFIETMKTLPNDPDLLVIGLFIRPHGSPSLTESAGTALFHLGVRLPVVVPPSAYEPFISLANGHGAIIIAGQNGPLEMFIAREDGLHRSDEQPDPNFGLRGEGEFKFRGGTLFARNGMAALENLTGLAGTFPAPKSEDGFSLEGHLVEPDLAMSRVFFLSRDDTSWVLSCFDWETFRMIDDQRIFGIEGTPRRLFRWGEDGLALLTSADQLFLIRTPLIPVGPNADLAISLTADPGSPRIDDAITFTAVVTNHGPEEAPEVFVSTVLSETAFIQSSTASQGTASHSAHATAFSLGSLNAGESAILTISVQAPESALISHVARVRGARRDPVPANDSSAVFVFVPEPADSTAILDIALPMKDYIRHPGSHLFYLSIPGTAGAFANSIVAFDSSSGTITAPLYVGSDPGKLAISADGGTLYVALDGAHAVQSVDLNTQTLQDRFSTPGGVIDMVVAPNDSRVLIASAGGADGLGATITAYSEGTPLLNRPQAGARLLASDHDSAIYSYGGITPFQFFRLTLSPTGLEEPALVPDFPASGGRFKIHEGVIYSSRGDVLDLGHENVSSLLLFEGRLVEPVPEARRLFYLTGFAGFPVLRVFDWPDMTPLDSVHLPPLRGDAMGLERWSDNDMALFTQGEQLVIFKNRVQSLPDLFDLAITDVSPAVPGLKGSVLSYGLTVVNHGPGDAREARLKVNFNPHLEDLSLQTTQGQWGAENGEWICDIGFLEKGGAVRIIIDAVAASEGTVVWDAQVYGERPDLHPSNNSVQTETLIGVPPLGPVISKLDLDIQDLVYDPSSRMIYAAAPSPGPFGANSVIRIDPARGVIGPGIPLPAEPSKLTLSDDGQFLYVYLDRILMICRIDLSTELCDLVFPVGPFEVNDFLVLPGNGDALAISSTDKRRRDYHQIVVVDRGVPRPNIFTADGSFYQLNSIAFVPPSTLYTQGYFQQGNGLVELRIDSNGVIAEQLLSTSLTRLSDLELHFEEGLLHTNAGQVIDPIHDQLVGTFANFGSGSRIAPDPAAGRILALIRKNIPARWAIESFHSETFEPAGSLDLPTAAGFAQRFIRWGADGLAFNNTSNQVFLIRTPLIPGIPGVDSDGDGIPDTWEIEHGLNPNLPSDALLDFDGDGAANLEEFLAGTDPRDKTSVFRLLNIDVSESHLILTFYGALDRVYHVERSHSLAGPDWTEASEPITGQGRIVDVTIPRQDGTSHSFYRVRLLNAPLP